MSRDLVECLTVKRNSEVTLKQAVGKANEKSVTISLVGRYASESDSTPASFRVCINNQSDNCRTSSCWFALKFVASRNFNRLKRKYKLKMVDV